KSFASSAVNMPVTVLTFAFSSADQLGAAHAAAAIDGQAATAAPVPPATRNVRRFRRRALSIKKPSSMLGRILHRDIHPGCCEFALFFTSNGRGIRIR